MTRNKIRRVILDVSVTAPALDAVALCFCASAENSHSSQISINREKEPVTGNGCLADRAWGVNRKSLNTRILPPRFTTIIDPAETPEIFFPETYWRAYRIKAHSHTAIIGSACGSEVPGYLEKPTLTFFDPDDTNYRPSLFYFHSQTSFYST